MKYNIYVDKEQINDKPLNNSETAFTIIQQYIGKRQVCSLDDMNKIFLTKDVNKYYFGENRPFNKLFFEYNENGEYETLNGEAVKIKDDRWDFWNDEKHVLSLSGGTKIIMLKMWRTGDLTSLVEKVGKLCSEIQVVVAGKDNVD